MNAGLLPGSFRSEREIREVVDGPAERLSHVVCDCSKPPLATKSGLITKQLHGICIRLAPTDLGATHPEFGKMPDAHPGFVEHSSVAMPARPRPGFFSWCAVVSLLAAPFVARAEVIPLERLPPSGMFQAGVPGGIPKNYAEFCDVTVKIPGSNLLAAADGVTDDSAAINAALSLCPANQYVYLPAGTYRIANTLKYPSRAVILRGAGSQTDAAHTDIKCDTVGTAVNMSGGTQFGGWLAGLQSGYNVGSTALSFSSPSDVAKVAVGDMLLVDEGSDPDFGVSIGGALESVNLPSTSYSWMASPSAPGAYYLESAGGGNPNLVQGNIGEMFFSPGAGTESILAQSSTFPLSSGQWTLGDNDSLGFNTIYVMLPGDVNPSALPAPGDGVPNGGVWYNKGISWGGSSQSAGGTYVHAGQGFKVMSISGATLYLDRPFYWTFAGNNVTASYYIPKGTGQGLESLSIQIMQASPAADAVIVANTADSWVRNVEVKNSAQNFIVASGTMDCEFSHNYVHEPFNAQGGSGYGIRMLGWNFNNLIEDNIAYFCRHSFEVDGMNTGLIIAYNFSLDPNDNANGALLSSLVNPVPNDGYLYQDFLTHGSNPRSCLFEGNVGGRGYCDYVHGSANNLVYFRNHFRLQEGHILSYVDFEGSETIDFDRWNTNMTVVGNILGYPAMNTDQLASDGSAMVYEGHFQAIYRLGYDADDNAHVISDNEPKATLVRSGNYDYVSNAIVWDPTNPDRSLPDSLYLTGTPGWFGALPWPPVDPTYPPLSEGSVSTPGTSLYPIIPAMYRFLNGTPPPPAPNLLNQTFTATAHADGTVSFSIDPTGFATFQWQVSTDGGTTWTPLVDSSTYSGETTSILTVMHASLSLSGNLYSCVATGSTGTVTSENGKLVVDASAPLIVNEPQSQTVATGSTAVFSISAIGTPTPSYQWFLNGTAASGATDSTLAIHGATSANAGNYTCTATNAVGSSTSNVATLGVVAALNPGRLESISCRSTVGTGANVLIAGFGVGGNATVGSESVLIRASGPALIPFGVSGTLPDPDLQLYSGSTVIGMNDGWAGNSQIASVASAVGEFAWRNTSSHDAALLESLPAGAYTVRIAGESGDTGVALAEIYDATPAGSYTLASPRIVNISARVEVGIGGNILIAGFAVGGTTSKTVLIRASGPALGAFGVVGVLPDPQLQLFSGSTLIEKNNGWGGNAEIADTAALVGAFPWSSATSNDSAILVTLPPGPYTAQVSGASGDTGIALVEVYEVP